MSHFKQLINIRFNKIPTSLCNFQKSLDLKDEVHSKINKINSLFSIYKLQRFIIFNKNKKSTIEKLKL